MIIFRGMMNLKKCLNKGTNIKKILILFLTLTIPASSVYAAGLQNQEESVINEDMTEQKGNLAEDEGAKRQVRKLDVEEEVTKVCGEVFALDVKLEGQPDFGSQDEAEDVLQYESADSNIAAIKKDESGEVQITAVGVGDTVIKITAPETEQYEKTEAQVKLHVIDAEAEIPKETGELTKPETGESEKPAEAENPAEPETGEPGKPAEAEDPAEPENLSEPQKEIPLETMYIRSGSRITALENVANGIKMKWEKVKGAKGYYLERSTTGKSPWSRIKTAANAADVTFTDTQVAKGSTYYYRVKAFDDYIKKGLTGASKKIVHLAAPSLKAAAAATGTELKWNRVAGCSGYCVYRKKPSQGSFMAVAKLTQPGEVTWRDTTAGNGNVYTYSVRAYKGSSLSPYASAKSYVRVTTPTVKSFKRKSSTKYKLTWKRNTSAAGYQIQYAQNGMFAGAKKVTVKGAEKSSYTLSRLEKKKTYYARVRAYKTVGGKTYYSGWSAAGNVKNTRTTKTTSLTKKKKKFEIRTWAKQKMYQYDTLQGSCTDGKYDYYLLYNRRVNNCKLVKVKRSGLKVTRVSGILHVAHGNDMTYDNHRKRLVIVHSTGVDPKRLTSVDPETLKVIESKHVQIPRKLTGGSKADAAGATAFNAVAYSSGRKQYVVLLSHNYNFVVLDSNLDPVRYIKVSKKNNYLPQGIDATDDYIMLAQSPKSSGQTYNIITVYDWDGNYISKINVKKGYEIESIYHVGSKYYAGFYCSYYKTYYKDVEKTVVVDGKEKKKKVKVKYRKLQRDNYVYRIKGI